MNQLHFISTSTFYRDVLEYIYVLSKEQITDFFYVEEEKYKSYRYNEKQSKTNCHQTQTDKRFKCLKSKSIIEYP